VPLRLVRHRRARRYVLRLSPDGSARVTIPRGGGAQEARRFAEKHLGWLEKQLVKRAAQPMASKAWQIGTEVLFRGELARIEAGVNGESGLVRFGGEALRLAEAGGDLRPAIERHLTNLAARELPMRLSELAVAHQFTVRRVSVRDQRSRWGSCSRRGTVSLNWRLVQVPLFVRDYILLHELAHLKEMNHSSRFWGEVARICPEYELAEAWLKKNAGLLK
jgi:predicted metal-dependent hydrolase